MISTTGKYYYNVYFSIQNNVNDILLLYVCSFPLDGVSIYKEDKYFLKIPYLCALSPLFLYHICNQIIKDI